MKLLRSLHELANRFTSGHMVDDSIPFDAEDLDACEFAEMSELLSSLEEDDNQEHNDDVHSEDDLSSSSSSSDDGDDDNGNDDSDDDNEDNDGDDNDEDEDNDGDEEEEEDDGDDEEEDDDDHEEGDENRARPIRKVTVYGLGPVEVWVINSRHSLQEFEEDIKSTVAGRSGRRPHEVRCKFTYFLTTTRLSLRSEDMLNYSWLQASRLISKVIVVIM